MSRSDGQHLVPLGETGWSVWRDVVLRSTGFPADTVLPLTDPALAASADAAEDDAYRAEYARAAERLSAAVREASKAPRFR
ncbi:hypothetical protein, partial [Kitasatospora sp. NPDC093558]|uniref:hypothetical protein n=1 Tax=Kitasatospora sp. NPDC093558 TaxID=3155201 RepID=UPI003428C502